MFSFPLLIEHLVSLEILEFNIACLKSCLIFNFIHPPPITLGAFIYEIVIETVLIVQKHVKKHAKYNIFT